MNRQEILDKAVECVCRDRNFRYGQPEYNFDKIAELWSAYKTDTSFSAKDVALMMVLLKVARASCREATLDSFVDIAGYAACGGEIVSKAQEKDDQKAETV